jgi:hypothetical protein
MKRCRFIQEYDFFYEFCTEDSGQYLRSGILLMEYLTSNSLTGPSIVFRLQMMHVE